MARISSLTTRPRLAGCDFWCQNIRAASRRNKIVMGGGVARTDLPEE
jgi:hypothetical protein